MSFIHKKEVARTYGTLMRYSRQFNDNLTRPTIDVDIFDKLHGTLYFDLTNQEEKLKASSCKLEFKHTLSVGPNADSNL